MMRQARVAGALLLGLPAAVLAHATVFGGGHTTAGAYHAWLLDAVCLSVGFLGLAFTLHAAFSASSVRNGSIVAARLYRFLPSLLPVAISAVGWYELIERLESRSLGVSILTLAVIAASAFAMHLAARAALRAISHAAVLVLGSLPRLDARPPAPRFFAAPPRVAFAVALARPLVRPPPLRP